MKLVMQKNDIHGADAGKAFSDAIAHNTVLQELDLSRQAWSTRKSLDAAFAKELAIGLSTNGAMTTIKIANNYLPDDGANALPDAPAEPSAQQLAPRRPVIGRQRSGRLAPALLRGAGRSAPDFWRPAPPDPGGDAPPAMRWQRRRRSSSGRASAVARRCAAAAWFAAGCAPAP